MLYTYTWLTPMLVSAIHYQHVGRGNVKYFEVSLVEVTVEVLRIRHVAQT